MINSKTQQPKASAYVVEECAQGMNSAWTTKICAQNRGDFCDSFDKIYPSFKQNPISPISIIATEMEKSPNQEIFLECDDHGVKLKLYLRAS